MASTDFFSLAPRGAPMPQGRAPRGHTPLSTNAEELTTRPSGVKSFVVSLSKRRNLNNTWRKHTHICLEDYRYVSVCCFAQFMGLTFSISSLILAHLLPPHFLLLHSGQRFCKQHHNERHGLMARHAFQMCYEAVLALNSWPRHSPSLLVLQLGVQHKYLSSTLQPSR